MESRHTRANSLFHRFVRNRTFVPPKNLVLLASSIRFISIRYEKKKFSSEALALHTGNGGERKEEGRGPPLGEEGNAGIRGIAIGHPLVHFPRA